MITIKLKSEADKIYKLESKLMKLKGKFRTSQEQGSDSDTEDSEESADETQEEVKQLEDKLEKSRQDYEALQETNNKLQETISILVEKISNNDKEIAELKFSLSQTKIDIKDRDKEILTLKTSLKENGSKNPRIFKVMAEELQTEKAKALTLNSEVKQLTEEIKSLKDHTVQRRQSLNYNNFTNNSSEEFSPEDKSQVLKSLSLQRRRRNYPEAYTEAVSTGPPSIKEELLLSSDDQNDTQQEIDTGDLSD